MSESRQHGALTIVARILPGKLEALRALLERMGGNIDEPQAGGVDFGKLETVHYMRWVIVDAPSSYGSFEPLLVLSTNHDPSYEAHIEDLVTTFGSTLDAIYEHCEGYPTEAQRSTDPTRVRAFFGERRIPYRAFYVGTTWRSVRQIREEAKLRNRLNEELDRMRSKPTTALATHRALREAASQDPALAWALEPPPPRTPNTFFVVVLAAIVAAIVVLATLPIWLLLFGFLRWKESVDAKHDDPSGQEALRRAREITNEMAGQEDHLIQNQLTHLVDIKRGAFRAFVLWAVHTAVNFLARHLYNRGHLGGIPSIHFARWVMLEEGCRVLFFSNYDGSWESYLGDFIDRAASGLTAVWSNTRRYPKTFFLLGRGARDEERFKTWARAQQIATQVWYSAYPELSVQNILNNTELRNGLAKATLSESEARAWCGKL